MRMKRNAVCFLGLLAGMMMGVATQAADVIISEFMAANTTTLTNNYGETSDWIELHNLSTNTVNLLDWTLTDSAKNLGKWHFPATNIGSGKFIVVYASGRDKRIAGAPLHTDFKLNSSGDYLALVRPDGTIASEFAPQFPGQFTDVSYGFPFIADGTTLVATNDPVKAFVPTNGDLQASWIRPEFNDSAWLSGFGGVGFDTGGSVSTEDTFVGTVQTAQPLGYWRFEETSGTTAANAGSLGAAANGVFQGGIALAGAGPRPSAFSGFDAANLAAQFNGLDAVVRVPFQAGLDFGIGPFAIELWFNPSDTSVRHDLFSSRSTTSEFSLRLVGSSANAITVYHNGVIGSGGAATNGSWSHLVVTRDAAANLSLYLNGAIVYSATDTNSMSLGSDFVVGGSLNSASGQMESLFSGRMDEVAVFGQGLDAAEVARHYLAAFGSGGILYTPFIGLDLRSAMFGVNSTAYVRYQFNLVDPSQLTRLTLRLRYDDGFVAYLNGTEVARRNAPETNDWASAATHSHPDSLAATFEELNLTTSMDSLAAGNNVLAIQGLNTSPNNPDFLIHAELTATTVGGYSLVPRYFTSPTPGATNGVGTTDLGPLISSVDSSFPPPARPAGGTAITVTAQVKPTVLSITNVTLVWRVMFGATNRLTMSDDGLHGDGAANDGTFGAVIPGGAATNGQMIRWYVLATDANGHASRWPLFDNPLDSDEYLGTVVSNPAITSKLPIFEMFVAPDQLAGIDTETGGRASFFYNGVLYDNIYAELRGNSSAGLLKKSHRVEFNHDHPLVHSPDYPPVIKTSLVADYHDPAYMRQQFSFKLLNAVGVPAPYFYPVHVRLNGDFYQLAMHNDVIGMEQVQRLGYSGDGALYKAAGNVSADHFSTGGWQKKSDPLGVYTDYDTLANAIAETVPLDQRRTNGFDMLDLPNLIGYAAVARWDSESDDVWANMSVYRDTTGDGLWRIIPFDMNASWGELYYNDNPAVNGGIHATNDFEKNHPLYGCQGIVGIGIGGAAAPHNFNRIYDIIFTVPQFREMYLRRVRTIMDRWIQPPETPATNLIFEKWISDNSNAVWTEAFLDRTKWGWPVGQAGYGLGANQWLTNGTDDVILKYIQPRRIHYFVTHSITNVSRTLVTNTASLTNTSRAGIPLPQPADAVISVCALDYNPASHNQAQEYICLTNPNPYSLDISGWKLGGAVSFTFKPGTVMGSNSALYVSPDIASFRARTTGPRGGQALFVVGPYNGQLSAWGETVTIQDDLGRWVTTNVYAGNPSLAQQYLRITEIMYNPAAGPGFDAQEFEYLEFKNISLDTALDLTGVHFTNGIDFSFTGSAVTNLAPQQTVLIAKNTNAFAARYGAGLNVAGQYQGYLNNGGETLRVDDANGEKILEFAYNNPWYPTTDGLGFSLVIANENAPWSMWGGASSWRASSRLYGSPGADDPAPLVLAPILVNEVLTHTIAPQLDAVELFNPTGTNVDLGGWFLSDDLQTPKKFRIPGATIIPANGYLVFTEAQFGVGPTAFALNAQGDDIYIFSGDASASLTGYYHGFSFGTAPTNLTFGRYVISTGAEHFVAQSTNTLGGPNALPLVGPVVISEIMYQPPDVWVGTNLVNDVTNEFVEIHNILNVPAPLFDPGYPTNAWHLRGGVDFDFPTNITLPAQGYALLVGFDPNTDSSTLALFRARYQVPADTLVLGPFSGHLDNQNDTVELTRPDAPIPPPAVDAGKVSYILVDRVEYQAGMPWPCGSGGNGNSLQRADSTQYGNDPINWVATVSTAGRPTPALAPGLPTIVEQPQSVATPVDTAAQFGVSVCGSPPFTYQWLFNDASLPGENYAVLQLQNVQLSNSGIYSVVISNAAGTLRSEAAALSAQLPPAIVTPPQSQSVLAYGPAVTFSVTAGSTPPFQYQWRFNGAALIGATNASLVLSNLQPAQEGDYNVLVMNTAGSMLSPTGRLSLLLPAHIVVQPPDGAIGSGSNYTLITTILGARPVSSPLVYQWRFNGIALPNASGSLTGTSSGNTNLSLVLSNASLINTGYYSLYVSNQYGTDLSRAAWLDVLLKPQVIQQPVHQIGAVGENATITAAASGTQPLQVRWRKGSAQFLDYVSLPGNTATLAFSRLVLTNGAWYSAVFKNAIYPNPVPSDSSAAGVLTVVKPPANRLGPQGATINLQAQVKAATNVFWSWDFNGTSLARGLDSSNFNTFSMATVSTNSLALTNLSSDQLGTYTFRVTNASVSYVTNVVGGNPVITTNWFALGDPRSFTATVGFGIQVDAPEIGQDPTNLVVRFGTNPTFYVAATGTAPLAYQWYLTDTNLLSGATNTSLVLSNAQHGQAGGYFVVVSNAAGMATSLVAQLTVLSQPWINTQPADVVVEPGLTAIFTVAADGTGASWYQWYKGASPITGQTNAVLFIDGANAARDNGGYKVVITNSYGSVTSRLASLLVGYVPFIATQPADLAVNVGASASFTAVVVGDSPLSYQWLKEGSLLVGQTNASLNLNNVQLAQVGGYRVIVTNAVGAVTSRVATLTLLGVPGFDTQPTDQTVVVGTTIIFNPVVHGANPLYYQWFKDTTLLLGQTTPYLILVSAQLTNSGGYQLVISNSAGMATSQVALLTVVLGAPTLITQPADQTVAEGAGASFSVTATGNGPLTYQWFKDAGLLGGQVRSSLLLSNVHAAQAGGYQVVVTGSGGSVTSSIARLIVVVAPVVTSQPASQTVAEGASVSFSVTATGTGPLSYLWRKAGLSLSGGTAATLTLSNVQTNDAGTYSVVVSNLAGSVTSAPAVLRVQYQRDFVFVNTNLIRIPDLSPAVPYPSVITASNVDGTLMKVTLTLSNFAHKWSGDVDALLSSPQGQTVLFMSDAGSGAAYGQSFTFDDNATGALPQFSALVSGTYRPTAYSTDEVLPSPAPTPPYGRALAAFNGAAPNGTWALFVRDDIYKDSGWITNGWSLLLRTEGLAGAPLTPPSVRLSTPVLLDPAHLQVTITGDAGQVVELLVSPDLSHWTTNLTFTNTTGNTVLTNSTTDAPYQFYRAHQR